MTDIEAQRLANLEQKEKLLAELNLNSRSLPLTKVKPTKLENGHITKKRRIVTPLPPTRTSARIRGITEQISYKDEPDLDVLESRIKSRHKKSTRWPKTSQSSRRQNASQPTLEVEAPTIPTLEINELRENWAKWEVEADHPTRDDQGTFHFLDHSSFLPNKSPEEMIREGSFGGSYWRPLKSRRLGIIVEDDWTELPDAWIAGLDADRYLTNPNYDADVNKYKVACGQSIEEWEASGWIRHEYDVRGWFQWYCRFFQGRRCADDERQVSRWRKCVGETGRWKRMLLKKYLQLGVRDVFDDGEDEDTPEVSPVMHQTCHHWAYEIKQHDLDNLWRSL